MKILFPFGPLSPSSDASPANWSLQSSKLFTHHNNSFFDMGVSFIKVRYNCVYFRDTICCCCRKQNIDGQGALFEWFKKDVSGAGIDLFFMFPIFSIDNYKVILWEFTTNPKISLSWAGFNTNFFRFVIKPRCCNKKITESLAINILFILLLEINKSRR